MTEKFYPEDYVMWASCEKCSTDRIVNDWHFDSTLEELECECETPEFQVVGYFKIKEIVHHTTNLICTRPIRCVGCNREFPKDAFCFVRYQGRNDTVPRCPSCADHAVRKGLGEIIP